MVKTQSEQEALLAEMRGDGSEVSGAAVLDADKEGIRGVPNPDEPLTIKPRDAGQSRVQRADSKHATRSGGTGFAVTVKGLYYGALREKEMPVGKRDKMARPYEVTVNVPSLEGALSVIKHKILPAVLPKKYKDFIQVYTHEIVKAVPLSPETKATNNLRYMDRPALLAYVDEYGVPINAAHDVYRDTAVLREAVIDHAVNPKNFEKREARRIQDAEETAALAELNPEMSAPAPKAEDEQAAPPATENPFA